MSCGQLRDYLSVRGIGTSGNKSELVARAFVAWEKNDPIKICAASLKQKLEKEYEARLKYGDISDPKLLPDGEWKNDVAKWPLMDLGKIFSFILEHKEFDVDYVGKYKTQKAYSYFDSKFVGTILCWINQDRCILKAEVTPSQKVRDDPRSVWICAKPNGDIVCAWCSCTAGYSQTCNHVIAVAYKVEYAVSKQYNTPASTSLACTWNASVRKNIEPCKVKNMDLRGASNHGKDGDFSGLQGARLAFEPRRGGDGKIAPSDIQTVLAGMEKINKKAVLFTALPSTHGRRVETLPSNIVETITNAAIEVTEEDNAMSAVMTSITLTPEQCHAIEVATRGQYLTQEWKEQKLGRITASKAHDMHTKVQSIIKSRKTGPGLISPLVNKILNGSEDIGYLKPIKYGIEHEKDGKKAFYTKEAVKHTIFTLKDPGLHVCHEMPYLAASPDCMMTCACCGTSVIEIKCPERLENKSVQDNVHMLEFVKNVNGDITLNPSHSYYTQVLMQMAVTKSSQGYFVIWSAVDSVIIKVKFDAEKWAGIQINLAMFYKKFVVPTLLNITPLHYCVVCSGLCLWKGEESKKIGKSSNCSSCQLYFHHTCIGEEINVSDWTCCACNDPEKEW